MVRKQEIKIWLLRKGFSHKDVADGVGVSKSYFSKFLKGEKKAPRIREWLLEQGCPAKFFKEGKKEAA